MKKKDGPQLFEIMRTSLAGKMVPPPIKKGTDEAPDATFAPAAGAVPPPPAEAPSSPVSPPLIVRPEAPPAPEPSAALAAPAPPPAPVEPIPAAVPESTPLTDEDLGLPAVPPPPPPPPLSPEPVISVPPPRPKPRPKARPFILKPPSPGLFEAGPEQRVILSYPLSLAAAAALFVLVFVAFSVGRTAPVDPPTPPPAAPKRPAAASPADAREHLMKIEPARPAPPAAAPRAPAPTPATRPWTIRLLEYEVTLPNAREEALQKHIEPTQKRLRDKFTVDTRVLEWTRGGKKYIGLFHGQWDSPQHPDIVKREPILRSLEPFNPGRKPFENSCKVMQEPPSD